VGGVRIDIRWTYLDDVVRGVCPRMELMHGPWLADYNPPGGTFDLDKFGEVVTNVGGIRIKAWVGRTTNVAKTIQIPPTIWISKISPMQGTIRIAWSVLNTTKQTRGTGIWQYWWMERPSIFSSSPYNLLSYFFGRKFDRCNFVIFDRQVLLFRDKRLRRELSRGVD